MHNPKSQGGSSTSQTETLGDRHQEEEEEDHRRAPRDHPQEAVGVVGAAEAVEVVEAVEEPSRYPDTHRPSRLKSF